MSLGVYFDLHFWQRQVLHAKHSPDRLMVGAPLLHRFDHSMHRLLVQRDEVGVQAVDIGPALAACVLDVCIHVGEGLLDLLDSIWIDALGGAVPTALILGQLRSEYLGRVGGCAHLGLNIRCYRRSGRLGYTRA